MDNEEIIKNEEKQTKEAVKKVLEKNKKVKAAKEAIKKGKNKIKKVLIKYLLIGSIGLVIALACFAGTMKIVGTMQELLNGITSVGNFIQEAWQWLRDDYWIKLDKKVEYVIDVNTEETLGLKDLMTDEDYKDEDGNQRETKIEEYTLVDKYVKELGNQGLSLKALRLLGDADYSDEDTLLQDEENKKIVEKYIAEFVRADIITQQPHRRRGKDLVKEGNENYIDGGVYFYRTKIDEGPNEKQFQEGQFSEEVTLSEDDYVQMEYIEYDEFQEKLSKNDKDLIYKFSIDDDGQVVIAEVKITTTKSSDTPLSGWIGDIDAWCQQQANKSEVYELSEIKVDYKSLISKYSMPYEFLVNLCQITQNPEFVYHVALLARDTKINLVVLDNGTTVREITDGESTVEKYKNYNDDSFSEATKVSSETKQTRNVQTTSTHTPILKVDYANTWSFYDKFNYNKNVKGELNDGPLVENTNPNFPPPDNKLHEFHKAETFEGQAVTGDELKDYWYEEFTIKTKSQTRVTTTTTEYLGGDVPTISVEKSKQFLGLLINKTGECTERNCDEITDLVSQKPKALKCAQNAVFERTLGKGYYVRYRIPNMTRFEAPYNRLTSDIQKLYASLQSNSIGYDPNGGILGEGENINDAIDDYIANDDVKSAYVVKMQGLVEHIRYLMTLPKNEDLEDYKEDVDKPIDEDEYGELNVDDLIVKTDEPGALKPVTKEQLQAAIGSAYSGQRRQNALSIVDTLISCQDSYKVNAIFILAVADQESNIGTAKSSHVKKNNWLSWALGSSYSSPQQNVETVMKNIATGKKFFTQGKITIKDIGLTYCPNTKDYPTQGDNWVINVTSKVKYLYSLIGIDIKETGEDNSGTVSVGNRSYKNYKQDSGSPWENNPFAGGKMRNSGCSITSIAIVLSGYGQNVTPEDVRQKVNGQIANLEAVLHGYGISTNRPGRTLTANEIKVHLQSNRPIIVNVKGEWTSSSGHYMVLGGYKESNGEGYVYVLNPGTVNSSKNGWVKISRITNNMKTQSIFITSN